MYVENVVIGVPLCNPEELLSFSHEDWEKNEKYRTLFTKERFLPRILVEAKIFPSVSEVRRNKPEFVRYLTEIDFLDKIKITKKRYLWILVGEEHSNE